MNHFTIMLVWGILTTVIGISMFFSLQPSFDCNTLPKGYWDSKCQQVNLIDIGLPFLPIGLGLGIIACAFLVFRDKNPNYKITAKSTESSE